MHIYQHPFIKVPLHARHRGGKDELGTALILKELTGQCVNNMVGSRRQRLFIQ